jgi:hypothetical protein
VVVVAVGHTSHTSFIDQVMRARLSMEGGEPAYTETNGYVELDAPKLLKKVDGRMKFAEHACYPVGDGAEVPTVARKPSHQRPITIVEGLRGHERKGCQFQSSCLCLSCAL